MTVWRARQGVPSTLSSQGGRILVAKVSPVLIVVSLVIGCGRANEAPLPDVPLLSKPSTLADEPVPKTLEEALTTLQRAGSGEFLARMRSEDESFAISSHGDPGRWIRNRWGLWDRRKQWALSSRVESARGAGLVSEHRTRDPRSRWSRSVGLGAERRARTRERPLPDRRVVGRHLPSGLDRRSRD
jgi:hypothetical protein